MTMGSGLSLRGESRDLNRSHCSSHAPDTYDQDKLDQHKLDQNNIHWAVIRSWDNDWLEIWLEVVRELPSSSRPNPII